MKNRLPNIKSETIEKIRFHSDSTIYLGNELMEELISQTDRVNERRFTRAPIPPSCALLFAIRNLVHESP